MNYPATLLTEKKIEKKRRDPQQKPSLRPSAIRSIAAVALLMLSVAFYLIAARYPQWISDTYKHFSRGFMHILGSLWNSPPFSVIEWLIYAGIVGVPTLLIVTGVRSKRHGHALRRWATLGSHLLLAVSVMLSVFLVGWAPNYRSAGLAYELGLEVRERSPEVLEAALSEIVDQLISAAEERQQWTLPQHFTTDRDRARIAWRDFAESDDRFADCSPLNCKQVTASRGLSYLGLTGVFVPLTGEASVNADFPQSGRIFTMCHETAHAMGYAAENEANFMAYLVCRDSALPEARYSGLLAAFSYCYNALCKVDREAAYQQWYRLPQQAVDDFHVRVEYWAQFEGEVQKAATSVNDAYLKTMNQQNGVQSYGEVVDLILADFVQRTGYVEGQA